MAKAPGAFSADPDMASSVLVNSAGNFECGGPHGDNGLSGKDLVVDAYGPRAPIGGGAMSGKDLFKLFQGGIDQPAGDGPWCLGAQAIDDVVDGISGVVDAIHQ